MTNVLIHRLDQLQQQLLILAPQSENKNMMMMVIMMVIMMIAVKLWYIKLFTLTLAIDKNIYTLAIHFPHSEVMNTLLDVDYITGIYCKDHLLPNHPVTSSHPRWLSSGSSWPRCLLVCRVRFSSWK